MKAATSNAQGVGLGSFAAVYVLTLAIASPILASRSTWFARFLPARWFPAAV